MPQTVPTAGTKTISAPASINCSADFKLTTGSSTPELCIFPAIMIPSKCFLAKATFLAIKSLVTPVPGLPVNKIKSKPSSLAFLKVAADAFLPGSIETLVEAKSKFSSTGSTFMPIGKPTSSFKR